MYRKTRCPSGGSVFTPEAGNSWCYSDSFNLRENFIEGCQIVIDDARGLRQRHWEDKDMDKRRRDVIYGRQFDGDVTLTIPLMLRRCCGYG